MAKTIIEDGIKKYKNVICDCGCGGRIIWNKCQKYNGIPKYIHGHHNRDIPMSEEQKEKQSKAMKKWHKEHLHPLLGKFGEDNPKYIDEYNQERNDAKYRGLEFYPLNEKTKIANTSHHIDEKLVVFIPEKLHRSVLHRTGQWESEANKKINRLAFKWLNDQGIELQRPLESF